MPKIYDNPKERRESASGEERIERERRSGSVGNGPAGLNAATENRWTLVAIVVVLAIVLLIAVLRVARGEGLQAQGRHAMVTPPELSDLIYHQVGSETAKVLYFQAI